MKKLLKIIILTTIILLIFMLKPKAKTKEYIYNQDFHSIQFETLNSKKINELFEGINGTLIEVEVKTEAFTKNYRFNTSMLNNLERKLSELVIKDLENEGHRELATIHQVQGFRITRIDIKCTLEELQKIKNRAHIE